MIKYIAIIVMLGWVALVINYWGNQISNHLIELIEIKMKEKTNGQ